MMTVDALRVQFFELYGREPAVEESQSSLWLPLNRLGELATQLF